MADKAEYREFFNEWWVWFTKSLNPPELNDKESDAFWADQIKDAGDLADKYGNVKFFNDIIRCGMDEIDRISRGKVLAKDGVQP